MLSKARFGQRWRFRPIRRVPGFIYSKVMSMLEMTLGLLLLLTAIYFISKK